MILKRVWLMAQSKNPKIIVGHHNVSIWFVEHSIINLSAIFLLKQIWNYLKIYDKPVDLIYFSINTNL